MLKFFKNSSGICVMIYLQIFLLSECNPSSKNLRNEKEPRKNSIDVFYRQNLSENEENEANVSNCLFLQTTENETEEHDSQSYISAKEKTKTNINRNIRDIPSHSSKLFPFEEQFKRLCRDVGSQPCTCYYPDHPNVTQFEFSSDGITKNASKINGTGPNNCEDLKSFGHVLNGFYMVRFNPKRVKIIYCGLNHTTQLIRQNVTRIQNYLEIDSIKSSSKVLRFCGGVGTQPCTFFYSDQPDSPHIEPRSNKINTSNDNGSIPTSCEDLKIIGYELKGFYLVRFNGIKVKIVYCDFKSITNENILKQRNTRAIVNQNKNGRSKVSRFCDEVGSQPCSCYYSKEPNTLQLELSSDPVTRTASSEKGTGPANCEDLQRIGHKIKGFYIVRSKSLRMKMIFCEFLKIEEAKDQTKGHKMPEVGPLAHEDLIGCLPYLHFKNEEFKACVMVNDKNLGSLVVASRCSNNNTKSFWVKKGMHHICSIYKPQCLTYRIQSSVGNVTLMGYNATSKAQQWTMDNETNQLVNIDTSHCLEPYGKKASHGAYLILQPCHPEKSKMKWSLNPVKNPTNDNRTQCTINQASTTRYSTNKIASGKYKNNKNDEFAESVDMQNVIEPTKKTQVLTSRRSTTMFKKDITISTFYHKEKEEEKKSKSSVSVKPTTNPMKKELELSSSTKSSTIKDLKPAFKPATLSARGNGALIKQSAPDLSIKVLTPSSSTITKHTKSLIFNPTSTLIKKGSFKINTSSTTSATSTSTDRPITKPKSKPFKLGEKIPLEHKDENSYLLRHHLGKCLAVSTTGNKRNSDDGAKIIMSDCNPSEKGQLWKLTTSNLCNEWGKCLTVDFKWYGGYTSNIFHWKNISGEDRQKWYPYDRLSSISHFGYLLSVNENSNPQEVVLNTRGKSHSDKWSFYTWNN